MSENVELVRQLLALLGGNTPSAAPSSCGAPLERAVLVTTEHRGVFFGYATDTSGDVVHLKRARMCVYWSSDMQGVLGLASRGPSGSCKVSPSSDLELRAVTAVAECSPEAVANWEKHPWAS